MAVGRRRGRGYGGDGGKNSERSRYGSLAFSRISRIMERPRDPLLIAARGSARAIFPRRPRLTVHSNRRDRRPRTDRQSAISPLSAGAYLVTRAADPLEQ